MRGSTTGAIVLVTCSNLGTVVVGNREDSSANDQDKPTKLNSLENPAKSNGLGFPKVTQSSLGQDPAHGELRKVPPC